MTSSASGFEEKRKQTTNKKTLFGVRVLAIACASAQPIQLGDELLLLALQLLETLGRCLVALVHVVLLQSRLQNLFRFVRHDA